MLTFPTGSMGAQRLERSGPAFRNGQALIVPAFLDPAEWVREELWVETEFDTDGDGRLDRIHVAVVGPGQTETAGLKVPVIYESSPYFSGTTGPTQSYFWDVRPERTLVTPESRTRSGGTPVQ